MLLRSPQIILGCLVYAALLVCTVPNSRADEPTDGEVKSSAETDVEQSAEQPTNGKTPGYALPPDSRSPFLPASFYREQEEEQEKQAQGLTQEFVRNNVALNAVVSANGAMTAIINRTLLREGDALTLEQNGQVYSLQIEEIKRNPPMAVLTHREQRFTVTAGQ